MRPTMRNGPPRSSDWPIERERFLFVTSLVEYYNRPNEWVEDAEFDIRADC